MKSYFLQVKEVIQETTDTITITFWHPLNEQIKYKAGQFLTLIVPADEGKKVRRSYSMSTSPVTDTAVGVSVKRVVGGLVSNYLNDRVKAGDFIEVIEPMGHFYVEPDAEKRREVVLIGAGSGITPLFSMAKTLLKAEPDTRVVLYYGNRQESSIIFKSALDELEKSYRDRFSVRHILSQPSITWVGEKGRISQGGLIHFLKDHQINIPQAEYFLCGPVPMMDDVLRVMDLYEVPASQIHQEKFNAPMLGEEAVAAAEVPGSQAYTVTIQYEGDTHAVLVEPHQTILEAALALDIDLPYSCQAGMCTACLGRCTQGKVTMDEEDGLTEKEIQAGYILTCVARPASADVVLEIE